MAAWNLRIHFEDGEITIIDADSSQPADDLEVDRGDTLAFKCEDHGWGIQFIGEGVPDNSNRELAQVHPRSVKGKAGESGTITVDSNAGRGKRWDYVAAVSHDDKVYTRDPDIKIKER